MNHGALGERGDGEQRIHTERARDDRAVAHEEAVVDVTCAVEHAARVIDRAGHLVPIGVKLPFSLASSVIYLVLEREWHPWPIYRVESVTADKLVLRNRLGNVFEWKRFDGTNWF